MNILEQLKLLRKDPATLTPEERKMVESYRRNVGGAMQSIGDAGSVFGSTLQAVSNVPGQMPNIANSALGGAISGFSSAGILGGIGGAFSGLLQGIQSGNNYDALMGDKDRLKGKTVYPGFFAEGGDVKPIVPEEEIEIQTEVGEMLLLPNGELVEVLAKDKHKDQKKGKVTDKVPVGTHVFSAKNKINLKKLKEEDDLIATYPGRYKEDGNIPLQEIRLTDVLGEDNITFAEAAKKIQKQIKTVEDYKDIFNDNANSLNIETRIPYLMKLMELQKRHSSGKKDVQTFQEGGEVGGPYYITNLDEIYDYEINPNGIIRARKKTGGDFSGGDWFSLNERLDDQRFEQAKNNLLQFVQEDSGAQDPQLQEYIKRASKNLQPLDPKQPSPISTGGNALAPNVLVPSLNTPKAPRPDDQVYGQTEPIESNSYFSGSDKYLEELSSELENLTEQSQSDYLRQLGEGSDLFKRQNRRAGFSFMADTLGNVLQDPTEDPVQRENTFLQSKYKKIPASVVEQQASSLRGSTAGIANEMLRNGLRPSEITSTLANLQGRELDQESNLRYNFFTQNYEQDRKLAGELNTNLNFNTEARTEAANRTRSNINQLTSNQFDALKNLISSRDKTDVNKVEYQNKALADFNKNKMDIFGNKLNVYGLSEQIRLAKLREEMEAKNYADFIKSLR